MIVTVTLFGWPGKHLTATRQYGCAVLVREGRGGSALNAQGALSALPADFLQMR